MRKLLFACVAFILTLLPVKTLARDNVDYWYIKNFESNISVNQDSSLLIDEKITADCGQCYNKHGIYRIVPTFYSAESGKKENLYLSLISITDFNGNQIPYQTTTDRINGTVTWKIGDANKTVQGVNDYEIKYKVKNGIRTTAGTYDEFYWNLNGNFWDIETDKFTANISLPTGINSDNAKISLYSGTFGDKRTNLAQTSWQSDGKLKVESNRTLAVGEGITISVSFPKGIVLGYKPTFFEKYGAYFSLLIPLLVFYFCFKLWQKYGKDPRINPTIAPEFAIPQNMSPMSLGMVTTDGRLKSGFISASIIGLAVKKAIKIEEVKSKGVFSSRDYKLTKLSKPTALNADEKVLLNQLFDESEEIMLSDLKNNFYRNIPVLSSFVKNTLVKKHLLLPYSRISQYLFIAVSFIVLVFGFSALAVSSVLGLSLILSFVIIFIFSFLMPRRTTEGAQFNKKILGFKLYMETAEKYRQKFNEKENIFEKFLPYAIMFGITTLWISKMKQIYGEDYFVHYYPYWFVGSMSHFDADSFNSAISNISSSMSSTITSAPSSSGVGGGGFSGGGGGGGGGGGW